MKQGLHLKLSQHLTLTPQLQQSIKLLQLSTVEMNQELERYLLENPLLERVDAASEPASTPPTQTYETGSGDSASAANDNAEPSEDHQHDFADSTFGDDIPYGNNNQNNNRQDDDDSEYAQLPAA